MWLHFFSSVAVSIFTFSAFNKSCNKWRLKRYKNHSSNYIKHENQPNENKIGERISLVALNFSAEISVDFSSVGKFRKLAKTEEEPKE